MPDTIGASSPPLRCLWLTRVDPVSPDAGDLTYSFYLLSSLQHAGARLTVLTSSRPGGRAAAPASAGDIEWIRAPARRNRGIGRRLSLRSLFGRLPNVATQYQTRWFRRALSRQLMRSWDAIVIDHLGMGWSWPIVKAYLRQNAGVASVFVAHQCEGDVRCAMARNFRGNPLHKLGLWVDALKADRLEKKLVAGSSLFSVITAEDGRRFGDLAKSVLLSPGYAGPRSACRMITEATPRRVLIFGTAVWLAKQMNLCEFISAADRLFSERQIELWVVGKVPERLRSIERRAVRFLGYIDDPWAIFNDVRLGVIPEKTGGGFKLKSLDYVFNRVPMAAIAGSVIGLPLAAARDYLSFPTLEALASGISEAIDDINLLNKMQMSAYAKCRSGFDWSERGKTLFDAIQETRAVSVWN